MGLKILMLGWEFPPHHYGGLGVACYGLIKALIEKGSTIILMLPKAQSSPLIGCTIYSMSESLEVVGIASALKPYLTPCQYAVQPRTQQEALLYGTTIFEEVERYAAVSAQLLAHEKFDVIHAHDWMTFKAGQAVKRISGKPLIVHVHATEFDRTGGNGVNQHVYAIERSGMQTADGILAVSTYTKNKIIEQYGIEPAKIHVVHNGVEHEECINEKLGPHNDRIVAFVGRLTLQKGPDYFVQTAKKIASLRSDITFVIAGSGDMQARLMDDVASSGLADKIMFTGFLNKPDVQKLLARADVYVMPSVSEPFGLTPLEALQQGTPVIIDRRAGVGEILNHCLKIDFWDINELVNKILAVINYRSLQQELTKNGQAQLRHFTWIGAADRCIALYKELKAHHA